MKKQYFKLEKIKFNDIKITEEFKQHKPKEYKQLGMIAYITKYGKLQNRIVVNMKNELLDGYVSYVVIKQHFKKHFKEIEVLRVKQCYYNLFEKYFKEGLEELGYKILILKGIEISPEDTLLEEQFSDARYYAINKMEQKGIRVFKK